MDILRELQQLLGDCVRIENARPLQMQPGRSTNSGEEIIPLAGGRYLVVDTSAIAPETAALLRFMLQQLNFASDGSECGWFKRLITDDWVDPTAFVRLLNEQGVSLPLPALLVVIEATGEGREAVPDMLRETLSEYTSVFMAEDQHGRCWLYLPLSEGSLEDWKESAITWADTLLTELYLDVRIGISRPANAGHDLLSCRQEAEIALKAGAAFQKKRAVHYFGELGLAHVLHGVSREAKAAFLQEVLPSAGDSGLTQDLRETVLSFAQHGQNIAETARSLFIHRNTLLYRLDKIHEATGRDIRKFEDLLILWLALTLDDEHTAQ